MVTKEQVYEALHECYDPEIPVNIVDLGLVYEVEVNDDNVAVKMTLTAPGCAMIAADAKEKILALEGVRDATVDLVWDPPWIRAESVTRQSRDSESVNNCSRTAARRRSGFSPIEA